MSRVTKCGTKAIKEQQRLFIAASRPNMTQTIIIGIKKRICTVEFDLLCLICHFVCL